MWRPSDIKRRDACPRSDWQTAVRSLGDDVLHVSRRASQPHRRITIVKGVLETTKVYLAKPECVLTTKTDFFGNVLDERDATLQKVQESHANETMFVKMVKVCLTAVAIVLERQYDRYFSMDINKKLEEETESARCHNIDAEEIIGMFSVAKDNAPNAKLNYLSSKIRAQKNGVVDYCRKDPGDPDVEDYRAEATAGKQKEIGPGAGGAGATDCP